MHLPLITLNILYSVFHLPAPNNPNYPLCSVPSTGPGSSRRPGGRIPAPHPKHPSRPSRSSRNGLHPCPHWNSHQTPAPPPLASWPSVRPRPRRCLRMVTRTTQLMTQSTSGKVAGPLPLVGCASLGLFDIYYLGSCKGSPPVSVNKGLIVAQVLLAAGVIYSGFRPTRDLCRSQASVCAGPDQ
jgi:hypothetical protein